MTPRAADSAPFPPISGNPATLPKVTRLLPYDNNALLDADYLWYGKGAYAKKFFLLETRHIALTKLAQALPEWKRAMEVHMITVTDSAKKELDAYFEGNPPSSIRVFLSGGG